MTTTAGCCFSESVGLIKLYSLFTGCRGCFSSSIDITLPLLLEYTIFLRGEYSSDAADAAAAAAAAAAEFSIEGIVMTTSETPWSVCFLDIFLGLTWLGSVGRC